ncbi:CCD81 protein, partial [Crotophaga sulcirostris]|nr:CCD81 protein [Crotophaga sulcirostris]
QGVEVAGLGTFTVAKERFYRRTERTELRRPVFHLDTESFGVQEVADPTAGTPGAVQTEPLDFPRLSQATSLPWHTVRCCVQETLLLYCSLLRSGQRLPFAFRSLGVLACEDNGLCMRFYTGCVTELESKASHVARLHA